MCLKSPIPRREHNGNKKDVKLERGVRWGFPLNRPVDPVHDRLIGPHLRFGDDGRRPTQRAVDEVVRLLPDPYPVIVHERRRKTRSNLLRAVHVLPVPPAE